MPYITGHNGLNEGIVERAEALFERIIGYQLAVAEYTDLIRYTKEGGYLKHTPVIKVLAIKARTNDYGMYHDFRKFFGKTSWVDIDRGQTILHQKDGRAVIVLPPTLYGSLYTEAEVTYEAGLVDIPEDVQAAILEIAFLLQNGDLDEWNCLLPHHIHDVVDKYRKGANE